MNSFPALLRLAVILGIACISSQADVAVSNVRSAQRAGTKLVDIDYNLAGSTSPFTVSVRVSSDDGATFTVPVTSLAGAFGAGQAAGANKRITWNAGVDWNGKYTPNMRFEVTATDTGLPPITHEFALIPAGSFQMGDQSNPQVGDSNELPVHTVYVSDFYMAKYETSSGLWKEVRDWAVASRRGYTDLDSGNGVAANHPVHSIYWDSVIKWCNARSEMEGLTPCYTMSGGIYRSGSSGGVVCNWNANGYRLPTEAEWEKAARGGQSALNFPWGNTITHNQANYYSSSSYFGYDVSLTRGFHPTWSKSIIPFTSPVGSFAPNDYGIYDMAGNALEWCWDWYGVYVSVSQIDPRGPDSGSSRVVRSGSWGDTFITNYGYKRLLNDCRIASRGAYVAPSGYYQMYYGFRLVRSTVP